MSTNNTYILTDFFCLQEIRKGFSLQERYYEN